MSRVKSKSNLHCGNLLVFLSSLLCLGFAGNITWGQNPSEITAQQNTTKRWSEPRQRATNDPYGLNSVPLEGQDIGVDSREGTLIDGDLQFLDTENRSVLFSDFFRGTRKPVMMSFNYSDCPKLCSVQLENMTLALREVDLRVGRDFEFISVSIDPQETTTTAKKNKEIYTRLYNRPDTNEGWHFLVGQEDSIKNLADQCGYIYKYIPEQKLYSHPPAFILLSPAGEIVRYIPGLDYDPQTIRLALIESAAGKIGSPVDWAMYSLGCFSYDGTMGKYTFQAMALMRIAGLVTVVLMLGCLIPYWFWGNREREKGSGNEAAIEPGRRGTAAVPRS
jgi:protein SCO1/2